MSLTKRQRNFCFTLNNYTQEQLEWWSTCVDADIGITYCCFGREISESLTPHLQGYFQCKSPISIRALVGRYPAREGLARISGKLPEAAGRPHLECANGTVTQNKEYCSKSCDPTTNPFIECGIASGENQGKRTDLEKCVKDIQDNHFNMIQIAQNHPTAFVKFSGGLQKLIACQTQRRNFMTDLIWYHGPTGTGKSRLAWEEYPEAYSKDPTTKWWDGYSGEETIIIDDYRPSKELPFNQLLRLADRYPMNVEMKGGWINFAPKRIIITTPKDPISTFQNLEWIGPEALDQLQRRISLTKDFTTHVAAICNFK